MTQAAQTIPGLTPALALTGGAQFWAVINGQDYRVTLDQIIGFVAGPVPFLIEQSGTLLLPGNSYAVKTSLGAFSGSLPLLSSVTPGAYVEIADIDNNAFVRNFTITASGSDQIDVFGSAVSSWPMATNNTIVRIYANTTAWRLIQYGG